jgi:iturin family lipopeptide synthetase B
MMDMHHIIGDFFSMNLFIKDFSAFCRSEELPPLNLQYKDFSLWQSIIGRKEQDEALNRQETYWLETLEGEVPVLNLPFDYARPASQQFGGAVVFFELDRETTALLKKMALEEEVTLFMVLLAVVNILLARVCDQEDILVGTPVAGRRHADLQPVIGFFVNMLVIRNQPGIQKTFRDFLKEVKAKTLKAYENQDYPYEALVDKLTLERDGSRNAVFDVLFVWEGPELELGYIPSIVTGAGTEGLKLKPCKLEKRSAIFDMILTGSESGENIHFSINYKTSLFKRKTIESIGKNFKEVIRAIVTDRNIKLRDIAISHGLIAAKSQALIEDRGDFGFS